LKLVIDVPRRSSSSFPIRNCCRSPCPNRCSPSADVRQRRAAAHVPRLPQRSRQKSDAGKASDDETISTIGSALMEALADPRFPRVSGTQPDRWTRSDLQALFPNLNRCSRQIRKTPEIAAMPSQPSEHSAGPALRSACEAWNLQAMHLLNRLPAVLSKSLDFFTHSQPIAERLSRSQLIPICSDVTPGLERSRGKRSPRNSRKLLSRSSVPGRAVRWTGVLKPVQFYDPHELSTKEAPGPRKSFSLGVSAVTEFALSGFTRANHCYNVARLAKHGGARCLCRLSCGSPASVRNDRSMGPQEQSWQENRSRSLDAARENIGSRLPARSLIRWDARSLPLADQSVSAVSANLPYGRRSALRETGALPLHSRRGRPGPSRRGDRNSAFHRQELMRDHFDSIPRSSSFPSATLKPAAFDQQSSSFRKILSSTALDHRLTRLQKAA